MPLHHISVDVEVLPKKAKKKLINSYRQKIIKKIRNNFETFYRKGVIYLSHTAYHVA